MKVFLNSQDVVLEDACTLFQLLHNQNFAEKKGIAVAINNQVVKRQDWDNRALQENDKVLVIAATKGG